MASSTSALLRSGIVADCKRPGRFIVAHPFNPPHLVPLVELVGEDEGVVARAAAFYRSLGRRPVVLRERDEDLPVGRRDLRALAQRQVDAARRDPDGVEHRADLLGEHAGLDEGIRSTVEWYREHSSDLRE